MNHEHDFSDDKSSMKNLITEQRWSIAYRADRIDIEPVENSCRMYDCCNGKDCGLTLEDAQKEVVDFFQNKAGYYKALSYEEFLESMGYHEDD